MSYPARTGLSLVQWKWEKMTQKERDHYLPAEHEYVTHATYSGPGCATCGQPEPGHKPKVEKCIDKNS